MSRDPISPMAELEVLGTHCQHLRLTRVAQTLPTLLEQAAQARELTHCVKQLSVEQQQCVALAYYQGLSHAEVAEHLTQPLGTVKSWVRRALGALKQCLARAAMAPVSDKPVQGA